MLTLKRALMLISEINPLSPNSFKNFELYIKNREHSDYDQLFPESDCLSQEEGKVVFDYYVKTEKGTKAYKNFHPLYVQFEKVICSFSGFCNTLGKSRISDNIKGGIFLLLMKNLYREIDLFFKDIEE